MPTDDEYEARPRAIMIVFKADEFDYEHVIQGLRGIVDDNSRYWVRAIHSGFKLIHEVEG